MLKGGPGMKRTEVCGAQRDIYLQALEYDANGRGMSGQEAITMHMITPSGATHTLPACLPKEALAQGDGALVGSWSP